MNRIHLFEFEDLYWFPDWLRSRMTRLIIVVHKMLKTDEIIAELIQPILENYRLSKIIDLCSGSGGPMIHVVNKLRQMDNFKNIQLILTDLYPNLSSAKLINSRYGHIQYSTEPLDATNVSEDYKGVRTLISGFHHMKPHLAKKILKSAQRSRQPIFIYEISDNSAPLLLWWIAIPVNIIMCLFITPLARPMTWQQLIFTYLIPIIPICFAWDGAVSNARTYTLRDMDQLLEGLESEDYIWEKGGIRGRSNNLYLIGQPA